MSASCVDGTLAEGAWTASALANLRLATRLAFRALFFQSKAREAVSLADLSIEFPGVPSATDEAAIIQALGRLTIAWSSSEFYLVLILHRLMASARLETTDDIAKAEAGSENMTVDTNAVFALYFSVESSRGRRQMVTNLASTRLGEGYLNQASFDAISDLLNTHASISKTRNRYAHTAMGRRDDGAYILLDAKLMISRNDHSARLKSSRNRSNNNRVDSNQIDDVASRLEDWISRARLLLQSIETQATTGSAE